MNVGDKIYYVTEPNGKPIMRRGEIIADYPQYYLVLVTTTDHKNQKRTYRETVHKIDSRIFSCHTGRGNCSPEERLLKKNQRELTIR